MEVTIQAIFRSPRLAGKAIQAVNRQLQRKQVEILFHGSSSDPAGLPHQRRRALLFCVGGALLGALAGAALVSLLPVPDADSDFSQNVLLTLALGAVAGALLGYVGGLLVMASVMTSEAKDLGEHLERGDIAVRVSTEAREAEQAAAILIRHGGYRSDGEPGVDRSDQLNANQVVA